MAVRDEFSNQAFAVQVLVDDHGVVTHVLIGRRPPGLYGGSDRSHLTGWKVFVDGVRNHVVGLGLHDALSRVLWLGTKAEGHRANAFAAMLRDETMKVILDRRHLEGDDKGGVKRGSLGELDTAPLKKKARVAETTTGPEPEPEADPDAEPKYPTMTPRIWHQRATQHWNETKGIAENYLRPFAPPPPASLDLADLDDEPEDPPDTDYAGDGNEGDAAGAPGFTAAQEYELCLLQRLISAYLHYRNSLPLTAVRENDPLGPATDALNKVLAAERTPDADLVSDDVDSDAQQELVNALWGLFDSRALGNLVTDHDAKDYLFGDQSASVDSKAICVAALADHVLSVEVAYPRAVARCHFRDWERPFTDRRVFAGWKSDLDAAGDDLPATVAPGPVTGLHPKAATGDADADGENIDSEDTGDEVIGDEAVDDASGDEVAGGMVVVGDEAGGELTAVFDRFAVQLDLNDGRTTIRTMYVGARPWSPPGRHTTAWVVLCDYVRSFVVGTELAAVVDAVDREFARISAIYEACGLDRPESLREYEGSALECAQLRIVDFLEFLNDSEGAIIDTGGLSGGGNEGRYRKVLQKAGAYETILRMFDWRCPSKLLDQTAEGDSQTDEGIDQFPTIALRVALHLYMCKAAYAQTLGPDTADALLGYRGLALLHASFAISTAAADQVNTRIWRVLTAPDAAEDDDFPAYDPDEFLVNHEQYIETGGQGSQDEYQPQSL